MRKFLLPMLAVACGRPDMVPTIEIRSPAEEAELDGYAFIDVRVAVEDESNQPVTIEYFIDGESAGTAEGDGCRGGCQVNGFASTEGFEDGHHVLTASVTDSRGNTVTVPDEEGVVFFVYDVPYIDTIAVHNTEEGGLNGPDMEVEVHILDEDTALYRGCAALTEVQEDDLPYEDLDKPFVYNTDGALLRYADIAFTPVRIVVIESDSGRHCPEWPELTELYETDVDQRYGITPSQDLSVLFNNEEIVLSNADFSGLVLKKGRPINRR